MDLWIDWQIELPKDEQKSIEALLLKAAEGALAHEKVDTPSEANLTVVSQETIRDINNQYRHIDKVTDVLSFPMLEYASDGDRQRELPKTRIQRAFAENDIDYDTGSVVLGDIVICFDRALEQAKEYGHSKERELAFLTVHSMLHLMGYDHMQSEDEKEMVGLQKEIMNEIGLPR